MHKIVCKTRTGEEIVTNGKLQIIIRWEKASGINNVEIQLPYSGVYGMGERFDHVNQKDETVENVIVEKFCHQGSRTYCPAPFFLTDTGFGLYVDTDKKTVFSFAAQIRLEIPEEAPLVLFTGSATQIIGEYMSLFGRAKLPPKWAFGPWASSNRWNSQAHVEEQLSLMKKHRIPITTLVLEAWSDEATFYIFNGASYDPVAGNEAVAYEAMDFEQSAYWSDPAAMIEKLHQAGIHLILWQIPVYKAMEADAAPDPQHIADQAYAAEHGLCVRQQDGTPYLIPDGNWFNGSMIPDFTNPATRAVWFGKRQYLSDIGVDGFKTDGGEFIYQDELQFHDGSDGVQMKNRYAQTYTQAYTEFCDETQILFSRAGYSGQHTTPIHWAGDQQSENEELKSVLKAGLSAGLTGIPFWSFDIGGFAGPLPDLSLYKRALRFGCFAPVMQWHSEPPDGQFKELMPAAGGNNDRTPWNIADYYQTPELIEEARYWHNLRMNLLPYLYDQALKCVAENRPMMRAFVYDYAADEVAIHICDEYMLGESLLVAPQTEEDGTREVYLPEGKWVNLFDETVYEGGTWHTHTDVDHIPVYLRSGYGIALNMTDGGLGSNVGNRTDEYKQLTFVLAGECGTYDFRDDLGNDCRISWSASGHKIRGTIQSEYCLRRLDIMSETRYNS